tara:strand:+ start:1489 stop:1701 length:213 start_codon:yes stop_codon:yes gene_type:complete
MHYTLGDRQAQSSALFFCSIIKLKNVFQIFGRNARSVVSYLNEDIAVFSTRAQSDMALIIDGLERIDKEV